MMNTPHPLSLLIAVLMAVQATLGLLLPGSYRDVAWIRATWFGNDLVTLLIATPLLLVALGLARRGSIRGLLLWLGMLGYALYNYAFYMLGAELNPFFPLYVGVVVLSGLALLLALVGLDVPRIATAFSAGARVRAVAAYLGVVAIGLTFAWMLGWAGYAFAGRPLAAGAGAFRLVAALDLTLMVPVLAAGAILLWLRRPWGYVVGAIAAVQGWAYLLVLTVNSAVAIGRGLVPAPGQAPLWGTLMVATGVAAAVLLLAASSEDPRTSGP